MGLSKKTLLFQNVQIIEDLFLNFFSKLEPLDNSPKYWFCNPIIEPIIDPPSRIDSSIRSGVNMIIKL